MTSATTTTTAAPSTQTCALTSDCSNTVPSNANRYCDNSVCSFRAPSPFLAFSRTRHAVLTLALLARKQAVALASPSRARRASQRRRRPPRWHPKRRRRARSRPSAPTRSRRTPTGTATTECAASVRPSPPPRCLLPPLRGWRTDGRRTPRILQAAGTATQRAARRASTLASAARAAPRGRRTPRSRPSPSSSRT